MDEVSSLGRLDLPFVTARPPVRLFHLVFESHDGRAWCRFRREARARERHRRCSGGGWSEKRLTLNGRLEKRPNRCDNRRLGPNPAIRTQRLSIVAANAARYRLFASTQPCLLSARMADRPNVRGNSGDVGIAQRSASLRRHWH